MSSAAPASALTSPVPGHLTPPPAGHCLNCHHRLAGPHCHHCGQAASTPARITGHYLLHDLPHSIWHVDHGVLYTLREMLLRPGHTIRRYLAGERQPFFRPLSLLLLVGGISAFLFSSLQITPFDTQQPGLSPRMADAQQQMLIIIQKYQTWISVLLLPLAATVATPLLRRATGYGWAEQLVGAALLNATIATVNLLFIPALAYWSGRPGVGKVGFLMTTLMLLYKTWGYAQLQAATAGAGRPLRRWLRGALVTVAEYLFTLLLFGGLLAALVFLRR